MPRSRRLQAPPSDTDSDSGGGVGDNRGAAPVQRNAANARERARMRVLSRAFCRLKTTLPWVPADTKLSKLDTLRLATSYIAHLRAVLTDEPPGHEARRFLHHRHPLTLTWPFNFHKTDSIPSSDTCMDQDQDHGDGEWCIQHPLPHVTALDSSREKTDVSYYY